MTTNNPFLITTNASILITMRSMMGGPFRNTMEKLRKATTKVLKRTYRQEASEQKYIGKEEEHPSDGKLV